MRRNPKQEGTNLFDCIPQEGLCPNRCNQCYYNRPGAFYLPIDQSHFPTLEEVGDGIVRVNSGHDSNIDRDYVIESTKQYPKRFFNTSIPRLRHFPDPVVFTANPKEEEKVYLPQDFVKDYDFKNVMFVRLRVSSTNFYHIIQAAEQWGIERVPVVLTFMRYYDVEAAVKQNDNFYQYRKSIKNDYWCPTEDFMRLTLQIVSQFNSKIKMCGTLTSSFCKDCLNCEKFYCQAKERMNESTTS